MATVTLQLPAGSNVPTQVCLPDGSSVTPAANGTITVSSIFLSALLAGGWQIVVTSGTTHVP